MRCNFCRIEFESEKFKKIEKDIKNLTGRVIGTGAKDVKDADIMTLKCSSCDAEIVINPDEVHQAKCHYCRNILTINQEIPNGMMSDMILPFKVTKEEAYKEITNYIENDKKVLKRYKGKFHLENAI